MRRAGEAPGRERFEGYGVMGLPFESGHVLGLRHFPYSSIGPGYTAVWHRSPAGRWAFYSTVAPGLSCGRYAGAIAAVSREARIELSWDAPDRLTVTVEDPRLTWDVALAASPLTAALGSLARRLPRRAWEDERALWLLGALAGGSLRAGRLALAGTMPNGQRFHLMPSRFWTVRRSTARLEGADLGRPAPLPEQARIGDFLVPQRGLLAVGATDFEP